MDNLPEGIFSLLDTDLYKLTMQCAVLKYFPSTRRYTKMWGELLLNSLDVSYSFTNRTPLMKFTREAYLWLQAQINSEGDFLFMSCQ